MNAKGIRIFDINKDGFESKLKDILHEIWYGENLKWLITFLGGMPYRDYAEHILEYQKMVNTSEDGTEIKWNDLNLLSDQYFQIYEIRLLGSINPDSLHRYSFTDEEESFEKCDIVIILIDCSFWEIYAKDQDLIEKLKLKFKKTEIIDID